MKIPRLNQRLIPMLYGCMSLLVLLVAALTTLVVSSFAITVAILK